MLIRALLVVDAPELRGRFRRLLGQLDVLVGVVNDLDRFWERLPEDESDLVFIARHLLPGPPHAAIAAARSLPHRTEVVVLAAREDPADRAQLLGAGCMAVIHQELPTDTLREALSALIERRREEGVQRISSGAEWSPPGARLADLASHSPVMQAFMGLVRRVGPSDSSLLILGETGAGKEWLARAIHADSPRARGSFVAVNCGALPEALLESELFGHVEGAFTGAVRSHRGYFELAHRGTIFLDEVGEMSPHLQVKLLRVLQDRQIQRVGSEKPLQVDVRVMAATNRDLMAEMKARRFREDLYFRLGVVTLTVPPLRERREDIPSLVSDCLERQRRRYGRAAQGIAPRALDALCRYDWPGNVRELVNVIERATLLSTGPEIDLADLPPAIAAAGGPTRGPGAPAAPAEVDLWAQWLERPLAEARREVVRAFERAYLARLLERSGGRIGQAARLAGVGPRSLFDKLREHGLRKEDFRGAPP